jgi:hypothetical protein
MNRDEELVFNVKACVCRRLRQLNVSVFQFARQSGVPPGLLVSALRSRQPPLTDLQELCSRLLLATIESIELWDPLTRRVILAFVLERPEQTPLNFSRG